MHDGSRSTGFGLLLALVLVLSGACAQQPASRTADPGSRDRAPHHSEHAGGHSPRPSRAADTAFAALQDRGAIAMDVDQYTSSHKFEALPDGGRIELQRDVEDSAGAARIRAHLQRIARAFRAGDFTTPAFVHEQAVPGADVMAARKDRITYTFAPLPRGGEVRITTTDPEALAAVHQFLAFQRRDHRVGRTHRQP